MKGMKRLIGTAAVAAAAIVAAAAFAGSSAASPGTYLQPSVGCDYASQTLSMTATAGPQAGFSVQTIAAQFYFRNIDTRAAWYAPSASQWVYFQNGFRDLGGGIAEIAPGQATLQYTVPRGHYEVFTRYSWWNGSQWTDTTGWIRSNQYVYGYWDPWVSGVRVSWLANNCPVGI